MLNKEAIKTCCFHFVLICTLRIKVDRKECTALNEEEKNLYRQNDIFFITLNVCYTLYTLDS